jgi:predicted metal-dependent hydrolase
MWSTRSNSRFVIETQHFMFRQWSLRLERMAYSRKLKLSLRQGKPIRVQAPPHISMQEIEQFVLENEKWIEGYMERFRKLEEEFPKKKLVQSETFPFLGENLQLRFVPTLLNQVFFSRQESFLNMHLPEGLWHDIKEEEIQVYFAQLKKFYQQEAEKLIPERLQIWSKQMQLFPKLVRLRNQKTRWGSCNSRGAININWRLMGAPLHVLDYILIHELAHLQHMDHSEKFWNLVQRHCADYQMAEDWLKKQHHQLAFLKK